VKTGNLGLKTNVCWEMAVQVTGRLGWKIGKSPTMRLMTERRVGKMSAVEGERGPQGPWGVEKLEGEGKTEMHSEGEGRKKSA